MDDLEDGNEVTWTAEIEAGSSYGNAVKADYVTDLSDVTVRNLVSRDNLDFSGDLVRVKFDSHSSSFFTITSAYLDVRNADTVNCENDCINPHTSTTRIQLYFTTDSITRVILESGAGNITKDGIVPAGETRFSNWTIFPIDSSKDYFVTFYISSGNASYWDGTDDNDTNSYLSYGNRAAEEDWDTPVDKTSEPPGNELPQPDPPGPEYISSRHIYAQASLEVWPKEGTVTSRIYDTILNAPNYDNIGWTESTGADISVSAASSDDSQMAGATWDSGSDVNPHSLSIGSGRYVQFKADLSTTPYWTCIDHSPVSVSDADYKIIGDTNKKCPTCSKYLIPAVNCPWIDNVAINWPGESRMCEISGYFTKKPDYGIIKLTVDGQELTKGLEFSVAISEKLQDKTYEASLTSEIEPRNTGR